MSPTIITQQEHGISSDQIDKDALYVINKLVNAGYRAYPVGGCVRDLLLGRTPKDFDIATSARPEQVKRLFRSCLLIGRRFRLAHIRFGKGHIIECATFRSGDTQTTDLILRDNTWGTEEEDALRRDFTMNGLFYDVAHETIIDYVGGFADIQRGLIRMIGEPVARFNQDPVRMIRLLKFQARFNLEIDAATLEAMKSCLPEILKSSPARILEELLRMLESGYSAPYFELMTQSGLGTYLIKHLDTFLRGRSKQRIYTHLAAADKMILSGRTFSRETLFALLIYPRIHWALEKRYAQTAEHPKPEEVTALVHSELDAITASLTYFPRRMRATVVYIMQHQLRVAPLDGQKPKRTRFLRHPDFTSTLELLEIRSQVETRYQECHTYWASRHTQTGKTDARSSQRHASSARPRRRSRSSSRRRQRPPPTE